MLRGAYTLHTYKRGESVNKVCCPQGSKFFPFQVDPLSRRCLMYRKGNSDESFCNLKQKYSGNLPSILIPLKKIHT